MPERTPREAGQILLVRHGETNDNRPPFRAQGWRDTPLNDTGRRQAREAATRFAARPPMATLWSSDLSRASETATIIGSELGLRPQLDPRLREGSRGRWEGSLFIDIERDEPELYAAWLRGGADFRFPGGESLREHQARVAEAVEEIRHAGPLPAAVVCHGGSIRVMLCRDDPRGLDAFHSFEVPNLGEVAL